MLYRQAADRLKPLDQARKRVRQQAIDRYARWSKADPEVRRWVEENREALALYRQGTERPDALDPVPPNGSRILEVMQALRSFHALALLEASRLEEQGDMAGAWGWYRAALRAIHHVGLHAGSTIAQ